MYLSKEEEQILNGELGEIKAKAIKILTTLGDIFNAEKLIPIESTQIAGISYKTIGDAGLEFIEDWSSAKVVVESRMNPAGMDLNDWQDLGIPREFAKKQLRIIRALTSMGVKKSCSCTPYLAGLVPTRRSHIAWSESSAVAFANSVLGAMTNREGGPSALSAALIGSTPNYGYHLTENRIAQMVFEVNFNLTNFDFTLLGYYIGTIAKNKIPLIKGIKKANWEQLKSLGAGCAASGGIAMYMIPNITPECESIEKPEKIVVSKKDLKEVQEKLSNGNKPDIITFGCPHCSYEEIQKIFVNVKTKNKIWIYTSNEVKERIKNIPSNIKILSDSCMVVSPIKELGIKCIATDSTKCAHYSQNLSQIKCVLKSREELLHGN
ncbi:MAG: aconitase X catalytic domain-containing protein [Promethearchaeota archaeon]